VTNLESSLKSIRSYFVERSKQDNESKECIFAKYIAPELSKITSDSIKQKVKHRLLEAVLDWVDEDREVQQQQQFQYVVLNYPGSMQLLNTPEAQNSVP